MTGSQDITIDYSGWTVERLIVTYEELDALLKYQKYLSDEDQDMWYECWKELKRRGLAHLV